MKIYSHQSEALDDLTEENNAERIGIGYNNFHNVFRFWWNKGNPALNYQHHKGMWT